MEAVLVAMMVMEVAVAVADRASLLRSSTSPDSNCLCVLLIMVATVDIQTSSVKNTQIIASASV